jgi:hypothetical protein
MAKQQVRKKSVTPTEQAADVPPPRRSRTTKLPALQTPAGAPTVDQIAQRAYFRFVERGRTPGHEVEDWLAAEAELKLR